MEWTIETNAWRWRMGVTAVGSLLLVGLFWWALADLALATFELPSKGLERWGDRETEPTDEGEADPLLAA